VVRRQASARRGFQEKITMQKKFTVALAALLLVAGAGGAWWWSDA
jgi:hypothetical protein